MFLIMVDVYPLCSMLLRIDERDKFRFRFSECLDSLSFPLTCICLSESASFGAAGRLGGTLLQDEVSSSVDREN